MNALASLPAGLVPRSALNHSQVEAMYALFSRHFAGVSRQRFEQDLAAKDWVIEVRDRARLLGFTSLRIVTMSWEGEPITALYSGDTIVTPEAWSSPALARTWITGVNHLRREHPGRRFFWLLLTSGFRTYRFLPVFWREFFPRHDASPPTSIARLLAHLAAEGYGPCFDPASGIVRFPESQRLLGPLAGVPAGREMNPHVRFFLERNPGHADGDELACLTEISEDNLTAAGWRMVASPHR